MLGHYRVKREVNFAGCSEQRQLSVLFRIHAFLRRHRDIIGERSSPSDCRHGNAHVRTVFTGVTPTQLQCSPWAIDYHMTYN